VIGYGSRVRRASFLVLAIFVVAGCGGGGSGGGAGGKRLTREQYASKADAICSRSNRQTKSLGKPKSLSELADQFDRALPVLDRTLAELRRLRPPASEQATVDQWLASSDRLRADLTIIRARARKKDAKGVQAAYLNAARNSKRGSTLAGKLGMTVCNKG
jgi:hypothetical protein